MPKQDDIAPQSTSVTYVSESLHSLRHSSIGLIQSDHSQESSRPASGADATGNMSAESALVVGELRRAFGMGLPFSLSGVEVDENRDYYLLDSFVVNRLFRCGQKAVGNYYTRYILSQPEGRHALVAKVMDEAVGCMKFVGWSIDRNRVFDLFSDIMPAKTSQERFIKQFAHLMSGQEPPAFEYAAILDLYNKLLDGVGVVSASLDGTLGDTRRDSILHAVCTIANASEDTSHPPLLNALVVMQAVLTLQPFQTANVFMARLMFSWVLYRTGYPMAAFAPVMEFLNHWKNNEIDDCNCYHPRVELTESCLHHGGFNEWTLWFEEMLGFMEAELDMFTDKLYGMLMRRQRMHFLLSKVETINVRQKDVLLEALLHSDAEFTYQSMMKQFDIAYATAYADLNNLKDKGYLKSSTSGKVTVFVASSHIRDLMHESLRRLIPEEYARIYNDDRTLTEEYLTKRNADIAMFRRSALTPQSYSYAHRPSFNRAGLASLLDDFYK